MPDTQLRGGGARRRPRAAAALAQAFAVSFAVALAISVPALLLPGCPAIPR